MLSSCFRKLQLLGLIIFLPTPVFAVELVLNGDFAAGLASWDASGDVTEVGLEAVLGDTDCSNFPCARLFQGVATTPGEYQFSFDILNLLSADADVGGFLDTVFGTLYYSADLGTFDIDSLNFDDALATFDADSTGVTNTPAGASLGASAKGGDWLHFSMPLFIAAPTFVIPTFELFSFNGVSGDSIFKVDNVSISAVPEPATLTLLGLGAIAGIRGRRRILKG